MGIGCSCATRGTTIAPAPGRFTAVNVDGVLAQGLDEKASNRVLAPVPIDAIEQSPFDHDIKQEAVEDVIGTAVDVALLDISIRRNKSP